MMGVAACLTILLFCFSLVRRRSVGMGRSRDASGFMQARVPFADGRVVFVVVEDMDRLHTL
jgi:hypothetical protein